MVFMPPQHGKSELVSRKLPAYILGKFPKKKVVLASYSSDLSSSFNRDCQRTIDSEEYRDVFPGTRLNGSNIVTVSKSWLRNSEIFEIVGEGGFLKTTGVGGALTGTAADFAIIDDPVKDSIEATSATYQLRNWNWYNDVLYTRIHNDTGILITQTRWNIKDLSGLLLTKMQEEGGEQWTVICLPAIRIDNLTPEDPREIGEELWPKRHNLEKLMMVQKQSLRTFQSLYQQNPQPVQAGGEFYKQFNIAKHTRRLEYDVNYPLHLSFDFNVNPYMTCTVWQVKGKFAYQIKEVCTSSPFNTTKGVCKEIKKLYHGHEAGMFIYGDPSGVKEDTRSEKGFNDYVIILGELKEFRPGLRVQKSAPPVVMRANFINDILEHNYGGLSIVIDARCTNTVNDMLYLKEDSDGTKKKDKAKDPSTSVTYELYGHTSDANDYFLCSCFMAEWLKYQKGGRDTQVYSGGNQSKNSY